MRRRELLKITDDPKHEVAPPTKRRRCKECPSKVDRKHSTYCMKCKKTICKEHSLRQIFCFVCIESP